jgi:hypothetical protein
MIFGGEDPPFFICPNCGPAAAEAGAIRARSRARAGGGGGCGAPMSFWVNLPDDPSAVGGDDERVLTRFEEKRKRLHVPA